MGDIKLSIDQFSTKIRLRHKYVDHKTRLGVKPENAANMVSLIGDDSTPKTWKGDGSFFYGLDSVKLLLLCESSLHEATPRNIRKFKETPQRHQDHLGTLRNDKMFS
jgi:hypothetical protein